MTIERSVIQQSRPRFVFSRARAGTLAKLSGLALVLLPLPGCQSITGNPSLSQVRIIDASPDAPGVDVYQDSSVLAYNLGLGTVTSYVPIAPGSFTINVDTAGTKQKLVASTGSFLRNGQYTVLVGNFAASLQETILTDQTIPAPAGTVSLRFLDASVRAGAIDLYLVPKGSTLVDTTSLLTNVLFNMNTGYLNVPTGTYTLVALPAGTVPTAKTATLYTGAAVTYIASAANRRWC